MEDFLGIPLEIVRNIIIALLAILIVYALYTLWTGNSLNFVSIIKGMLIWYSG
jgi:hypothetical protein